MSCPTCDHTMHCVNDETQKIYHCPRCGTMTIAHHTDPKNPTVYVPKLVERCRKFGFALARDLPNATEELAEQWHTLGIAEAIHKPEDRPK